VFSSASSAPAVLATDASGDTLAVWAASNGTNTIIESAVRIAGGTLSPPVALSTGGENASCPVLAMDDAGDATVAWLRSNGSNEVVQVAYGSVRGTFSAPIALSAAGADSTCPQVVIGSHDESTVAWTIADGSGSDVDVASRPASGSFAASVDVSGAASDVGGVQLVGDPGGDVAALWEEKNGTTYVLDIASKPADATIGAPETVSDPTQTLDGGYVAAFSAGGVLTLAYGELASGSSYEFDTAQLNAAGQFGPSAKLASSTPDVLFGFSLASNARGNAVVAWRSLDFATGAETVQAASRPGPSSGWTTPATVDSGTVASGVNGLAVVLALGVPVVSLDSNGDAVAAWQSPADVVLAAEMPSGGAFEAAEQLSPAADLTGPPQITADASGDTVVAWGSGAGPPAYSPEASFAAHGGPFGAAAAIGPSGATLSGLTMDASGDAVASWTNLDGAQYDTGITGFENTPPQLASVSVPARGEAGSSLTFSATGSSVWSPLSTTWAWDDGSTNSTGSSVTHTFAQPGTYQVVVSLTDQLGNTVSTTRTVTVTEPGPGPSSQSGSTPATATLGAISLSGATARVPLTCSGAASQTCSGTIVLTAPQRLRRRSVTVQVARTNYSIRAGRSTRLTLVLNTLGRKLLAITYQLKVTLRLTGSGRAIRTVSFAYQRVSSTVSWLWDYNEAYTVAQSLVIAGLRPGAVVVLSCAGPHCPLHRQTVRPKKRQSSLDLTQALAGKRFTSLDSFQVAVTRAQEVAKIVIFRFERGLAPTVAVRCLPPGATDPVRCP
jgi:plastocyanin